MSDGENVFDKQLIEEVGETLKEEKMKEEEKPGLLGSIFGKKEENVEEEKVEEEKPGLLGSIFGKKEENVEEEKVEEEKGEEEKGEEKPGLLSSLFGKKEEEKVEEEKVEEEIDCDDLLMKMKECSKEEDISTSCRDVFDQWENICNARSWFGN